MPSPPRLIDALPPAPPPAIQVLVLGMSRTGTMSMKVALDTLGYKTLHAATVPETPGWRYWNEAIDAKFHGKGTPYGTPEFHKMLQKFTAVSDMPAILFVDELLAAYPRARVVLTNRDVDSWAASMDASVYVVLREPLNRFHERYNPKGLGAAFACIRRVTTIWAGGDFEDRGKLRQGFRQHYAHVRAVVPKDNLLEFESKDGWEPLCKFLGKDVPTEGITYPRVNDAKATVLLLRSVSRLFLAIMLGKVAAVGFGVVAVVWGLQRYRSSLMLLTSPFR